MMNRVVIVGGGISGLAAAFRLQHRLPAAHITVLEKSGRVGGFIGTVHREGFTVETGPNGFRDNKPGMLDLAREVGLGDRLVPASEISGRNRYLFLDGRLRRLPGTILSLLGTDLLSLSGKLNLLAEPFRPRRTDTRDESIAAFARRRAGREVAEVFADGVVTGILAGDPELLSVRASFPQLVQLEQEYGSIFYGIFRTARRVRMWSFREGLGLMIDTIRDRLKSPPIVGAAVRRIERLADSPPDRPVWAVCGEGTDRWTADAVVLACPASCQAALLAGLDPELAEQIGGIPCNRIAVVALGYRQADVPRPLDGFGYIAPQRTRRDLLGVQWCSSIFPDRAPSGMVLVRALCGGWHRAEVVGWDDARLIAAVRAELRLASQITAAPCFSHIVRWDRAIPQYLLGHDDRVTWISRRMQRHPGLFLTGNAYHGVALNDCTEQAAATAQRVEHYLARGV